MDLFNQALLTDAVRAEESEQKSIYRSINALDVSLQVVPQALEAVFGAITLALAEQFTGDGSLKTSHATIYSYPRLPCTWTRWGPTCLSGGPRPVARGVFSALLAQHPRLSWVPALESGGGARGRADRPRCLCYFQPCHQAGGAGSARPDGETHWRALGDRRRLLL